MSSRYTKNIPEYVYFVGENGWIQGPFVNPKKGYINRKFKLTEVEVENPKKSNEKITKNKKS